MNNTITKKECKRILDQLDPLINSLQDLEYLFKEEHYFYTAETTNLAWIILYQVKGAILGYIETLTKEKEANHECK